MSIECPACKVERDLESYTLTRHPTAGSVCDFCQEAGAKAPEAPQEPKKRGRKPKVPPDPVRPVESPPEGPKSTPKSTDLISDEAAAQPYAAPAFDEQAARTNPDKEVAARELCRRRLMPFIQRFRPKYMPGWVHKDICRRLERFVEAVERGEEPRLLLMMPPRGGKQLADETMVPTPTGWRRHGELKAGDEVFHPSGRPVRVLATSEKTPSDVKVTFSDGSEFFCHENHEWTLYNRMRGEWQTLETNHFLKPTRFGKAKQATQGNRCMYQLPVAEPLRYTNSEFLAHPYVLGAWLGDGSAGKPCITGAKGDQAIIDRIVSLGYPVSTVCEHQTTGVLTTYFSGDGVSDAGLVPKRRGPIPGKLSQELEALGVFRDKHIPDSYKRLTVDLRLQLLAGLIDTDGDADKNGRLTFTTASRRLADDVLELVSGLGFRPYAQEVEPRLSSSGIQGRKVYWRVGFQPTMAVPTVLARKTVTRFAKQRRVGLVSVERVGGDRQGNCIQVDSPDGLYVVGEKLTVTHNSEIGSRHFAPWVLGKHPDWEIIAASHTGSLSLSFSRYIRDLLRDPAYQVLFPDTVLDASSQSVENWNLTKGGGYLAAGVGTGITGRGAHCLPLTERILTSEGEKTIYELIKGNEKAQYVLSYANGQLAYRRINAILTRKAKGVFTVTLDSGVSFKATGEHPVCVGFERPEGRPIYRRVDDLRAGESVVVFRSDAADQKACCVDEVPSVRDALHQEPVETAGAQGPVREADAHVLERVHGCDEDRAEDRNPGLRRLWRGLQLAALNLRSAFGAWKQASLLLKGVQRGVSFQGDCGRETPAVLQGGADLHAVQEAIPERVLRCAVVHDQAAVLQPELLSHLASWSPYREGYRSGFATILPARVQARETEDARREGAVCRVYVSGHAATSQGRGHREQRPAELGPSVLPLPQEASRQHSASIVVSVTYEEGEIEVGDLEVEGTHNFLLPSGTLLLNCLILDDLVKDQEAADSPTIRENTWEWYISTAHSRLAPGGGVLGIMCLTGDTMVMMADGSHRRLDTLRKSDDVATYANGSLKATKVKAFKSNGRDSVFKIKTISGKIVRANQRHPFLTVDPKGELVWTRTRALTTAHKIVTVKGNGVSGRASVAPLMAVTSLRSAGECADLIIQKSGGLTAEGQSPTTTRLVETPASSIAMESRQPNTTRCSSGKVAAAQFAKNPQVPGAHQITGKTSSRSTTVTRQGLCEGSCAMAAMQESDTLGLSRWHWPRPNISDFTLEEVVSVEADGSEEVFDVQIEHTENFIANGFVSHNTWWSEDDWAGRIQETMKGDGEKFEIVRYPAINDEGDEYILPDDSIEQIPPGSPVPEGSVMTRPMNSALHPERYDLKSLLKKKLNYMAAGMVRMWNALYQQNPTPDSGIMFTKDLFRRYVHPPSRRGRLIYQAWDFAITEKTASDWTVCATIMQDEFDNLYVLDVFRFKSGDGNAIVEHMIDQYVLWDADYLGMEDGQIWKTMQSQFEKRCKERKVYPSTQILVPLTDKLVRANPIKGRMQLGKVYFPEEGSCPWVDVCVREMIVFPNGKHDDQVDALAWAVRMTLDRPPPKDPTPKTKAPESWRKKLERMLNGQGGGHMSA